MLRNILLPLKSATNRFNGTHSLFKTYKRHLTIPSSPNKIFFEGYYDPAASRLLRLEAEKNKIHTFLDSFPKKGTIKQVIDTLAIRMEEFKIYSKALAANGWDLSKRTDCENLILQLLKEHGISGKGSEMSKVAHLSLLNHSANVEFKQVAELFEKNNTKYLCTDLNETMECNEYLELLSLFDKRNSNFSEEYLTRLSTGFYARNNYSNMAGIQQEILKRISFAQASACFAFFFVHSNSVHPEDPNNPVHLMKNGSLPFGYIDIDTSKMSDSKALDTINQVIKEKEQILSIMKDDTEKLGTPRP